MSKVGFRNKWTNYRFLQIIIGELVGWFESFWFLVHILPWTHANSTREEIWLLSMGPYSCVSFGSYILFYSYQIFSADVNLLMFASFSETIRWLITLLQGSDFFYYYLTLMNFLFNLPFRFTIVHTGTTTKTSFHKNINA
jgi:hypothetical protein